MPDPTRLERPAAAAEAQFGRAGRTLTPEQQQNWEAGQRIRRKRAENTGEQSVLESFVPSPPPTEARVNHVNAENIGMRRRGGDVPNAGEREYRQNERSIAFRKRADKFSSLAQELLEKGYDGLGDTAAVPDTTRGRGGREVTVGREAFTTVDKKNFLVTEMLEASKSWPAARAVLESYGPPTDAAAETARRELVEQMLRDPKLLKSLTLHFGEIYDGENAILQEAFLQAQENFEIEKNKKDQIEARINETTAELGIINAKLGGYENPTVVGSPAHELATLKASPYANEAAVQRLQDDLETQKAIIRRNQELVDRRTGVLAPAAQTAITNAQHEIDTRIRGELARAQHEVARVRELQQDQDALTNKRVEMNREAAELREKLADADITAEQAEREFNKAKALRVAQEEEFVNKIEGMFREAGRRHVKEDARMNEAAQKKLVEKAKAEAMGRDEDALLKSMDKNWRRKKMVGVVRTRNVEEVNKENVRADYEKALSQRGMEWYVKASMSAHLDTLTPGSPEYIEEEARLNDRFNDKEFMKKMNGIAMERLFRNYLESGNKIKKEDVAVLFDSEGGLAAVDRALESNKAIAATIEKLKVEKGFSGSNGEFIARIAKDKRTHQGVAGLLALLFASPFLLAGGAVAGALYEKGVEAAFAGSGTALSALG